MTARLRELLHELADELANTLEGKSSEVAAPPAAPSEPTPPPKSIPRQRRAAVRLPPMPSEIPDEVTMRRAQRALENAGFMKVK